MKYQRYIELLKICIRPADKIIHIADQIPVLYASHPHSLFYSHALVSLLCLNTTLRTTSLT